MCRRNQNGVRPLGSLIHIMLLASLFSGLIIVYALASDETVAATTWPDAEGQILTQQNSFYPHPDFGPQDVVRIQLEALANNNDPYNDAGIEITFRFASPSNKQATGPLSRFIRMLYNPLYLPMLDHQTATYGELVKENDQALQSVILTAADGQRVGYIFILSKQKGGPFDQCWMTDSVLRFELDTV